MISATERRPMTVELGWREPSYLLWAFVASAGLHGIVFLDGYAAPRFSRPAVELDLTLSGHIGRPGGGRTTNPAATPESKDWVRAKPDQKTPVPTPKIVSEAAKPEPIAAPDNAEATVNANAAAAGAGEIGDGDGNGGLSQLSRLPQLLNLKDLRTILRRFYPETERLNRREGTVVLDLHVDTAGRVTAVDVVRSASPAFVDAARRVGSLLRFSPAYVGAEKVPVRLRQAIRFNMEN